MKRQQNNGTQSYARLHKRGLTLPQQSAVDLLASGKNDTETAELLKLNRVTVTKWRLYDPVFQAAVNGRRAEVWGAALNRLQALIPRALETLAAELDRAESPQCWKAAVEILRMVQVRPSAPTGPTSAEAIVDAMVQARVAAKKAEREKYLSQTDRMLASMHSPSREECERHEREARAEVLAEIEANLTEQEGSAPDA
jgi:hypothetical protein